MKESPWYGTFWSSTSNAGWIYHTIHGWQYADGSSPEDVYLYDNGLQAWLYTNSMLYPNFYNYRREEFMRYEAGTQDPREFFGYSTNQVFSDGLARAPIDTVEFMKGLTFADQARVAIYFRLVGVDGNPVASPSAENYTLLENGSALNPYESLMRVTEEPDSISNYSLLAIDLSGSIRITPGALTSLLEAAGKYVNSVMADGNHNLGIAYFANDLVIVGDDFTDDKDTALDRLEQLKIVVPNDTTTNLHGAFLSGAEKLNDLQQSEEDLLIRSLVVFTDGQDQAGVNTSGSVLGLVQTEDAKDNGVSFYTIGTGAGVDYTLLEQFGSSGFWKADTNQDLGPAFDAVAAAVSNQGRGIVLVEYESPKRSGFVDVEINLDDDGNIFTWNFNFSAVNFKSPLPVIDVDSFPVKLLIDSGIRINYKLASPLYDQFDHAVRVEFDGITDFGGYSQLRPVSAQKEDFPYEAIFPGRERIVQNQINYTFYNQPAKVYVTVKTKEGIVFKQSEPADLQFGEAQSVLIGNSLETEVSRDTYSIFSTSYNSVLEYDRSLLEFRGVASILGGWKLGSDSDLLYFFSLGSYDETDTNERIDLYSYNNLTREYTFHPIPDEILPTEEDYAYMIHVTNDGRYVLFQAGPSAVSNRKLMLYDSEERTYEEITLDAVPGTNTAFSITDNGRYIGFNRRTTSPTINTIYRYDRLEDNWEETSLVFPSGSEIMPTNFNDFKMSGDGRIIAAPANEGNDKIGFVIHDFNGPYMGQYPFVKIRAGTGNSHYITPAVDFTIWVAFGVTLTQGQYVYTQMDPFDNDRPWPVIPKGWRTYANPWVMLPLASSFDNNALLVLSQWDLRLPTGGLQMQMSPAFPTYGAQAQLIKYASRMRSD